MSNEYELPKAVVARLVKEALPSGVNVSGEAKAAFGVAARVFVSYLTATANELAQGNKRGRVSSADVLAAIEEMDFGQFSDQLNETLEQFKQDQINKRSKKSAAKKDTPAAGGAPAAAAASAAAEAEAEADVSMSEEQEDILAQDEAEEEGEEEGASMAT